MKETMQRSIAGAPYGNSGANYLAAAGPKTRAIIAARNQATVQPLPDKLLHRFSGSEVFRHARTSEKVPGPTCTRNMSIHFAK